MYRLNNQLGFVPTFILILILIIGAASIVVIKNNPFNTPQPTPDKGFQRNATSTKINSPTPTPNSTASPTSKPLSTSSPTPSPSSTSSPSPAPSPTATPSPASTETPTASPTPAPTATPNTTKPTISITNGPYSSNGQGPCFDVTASHPNCYELSARYSTDNGSESVASLTASGACTYTGTICTIYSGSHTFKVKSRAVSTNVESDEVTKDYTYP